MNLYRLVLPAGMAFAIGLGAPMPSAETRASDATKGFVALAANSCAVHSASDCWEPDNRGTDDDAGARVGWSETDDAGSHEPWAITVGCSRTPVHGLTQGSPLATRSAFTLPFATAPPAALIS